MSTKVKVAFPLAGKSVTVERDVEEENESIVEAIADLLSEIAPLSQLEMKGHEPKHEIAAVGSKPSETSKAWVYRTQQPSAKFVERYAELMEEAEETEEAKEKEVEKQDYSHSKK